MLSSLAPTPSKQRDHDITLTWRSSRLDTSTIVDEAQALLYGPGRLRTREMMTAMVFTMQQNYAAQTLPANFLDPIGPIYVSTFNTPIRHKDSQFVQRFTKASILRRSRPLFLAQHSAAKRRPLAPAP